MELLNFRVPVKRQQSEQRPLVICPIGDLQFTGQKGSLAGDLLKRHLDRCLELGGFFLGMGDYIDAFSPSNRQRLRAAALYDTAEDVIDDKVMELVDELFDKYLKPTKGRWLGLLHGHHFATLKTGQ